MIPNATGRLGAVAVLSCAWLSSCASDSGSKPAAGGEAGGFKSLSQRMEESNGFAQDGEGKWVPKVDKRSSFENQGASPYFKGSVAKKEFKTGEFMKKSWWGTKEFGHKKYEGETDGGRFIKKSRFSGMGAREAGTQVDLPGAYRTETYATHGAREANTRSIARPADVETEFRESVFKQPPELDYREARSMSLEQSRGILGR